MRPQSVDYKHTIEIHHWEYMEALLPILALFKHMSKYLKADEYPTGSKALRRLWTLEKTPVKIRHEASKTSIDLAIKAFDDDCSRKMGWQMDDSTLIW